MADSPDPLLFAILAMNSYSMNAVGAAIGDAVIVKVESDTNAVAAGFYAVAYELPNGSIVIAYRGTVASSASALVEDVVNGWPLGDGDPYAPQGQLAILFYQQVTQAYPGATISVTGHSLGGGLSGVLFDSMDFESAAEDFNRSAAVAANDNACRRRRRAA